MPSADQQRCAICGDDLFPHYPDDDSLVGTPDDWRCPKCHARYGWNEGFMLSAEWAAEEIKQLHAGIAALEEKLRLGGILANCVPGLRLRLLRSDGNETGGDHLIDIIQQLGQEGQ